MARLPVVLEPGAGGGSQFVARYVLLLPGGERAMAARV